MALNKKSKVTVRLDFMDDRSNEETVTLHLDKDGKCEGWVYTYGIGKDSHSRHIVVSAIKTLCKLLPYFEGEGDKQ